MWHYILLLLMADHGCALNVLSQAIKGHIPPYNGASVCVAGAAGMNVTPERINEACQPLINVNRMKGSYQKRQTKK